MFGISFTIKCRAFEISSERCEDLLVRVGTRSAFWSSYENFCNSRARRGRFFKSWIFERVPMA